MLQAFETFFDDSFELLVIGLNIGQKIDQHTKMRVEYLRIVINHVEQTFDRILFFGCIALFSKRKAKEVNE